MKHVPWSIRMISTIVLYGMSTLCVHMQLAPQLAGLFSPLQNCSGGMSSICEISGADGKVKEISFTRDVKMIPVCETAIHKRSI